MEPAATPTRAASLPPGPARAARQLAWQPAQPRRHDTRYSQVVSLLRYLLPILAIALLALVAIWPQIHRGVDGFRLQTLKLDPSDISTLRMSNARYQGVDERNRPYLLTAVGAVQNPRDKNFVALEAPKADLKLENGAGVTVVAESGIYDGSGKKLDLMGKVRVTRDDGYVFETEVARVDLRSGVVEGNDPVLGHGPGGTVRADGFRVLQKGEVVEFKGQSRLLLPPGATAPKP
jgi:lipopolysaccharide export system protein LptC